MLIISSYNTIFNAIGIPEGFAFTVMNVTGDTCICGMVAHLCPAYVDETIQSNSSSSNGDEENINNKEKIYGENNIFLHVNGHVSFFFKA